MCETGRGCTPPILLVADGAVVNAFSVDARVGGEISLSASGALDVSGPLTIDTGGSVYADGVPDATLTAGNITLANSGAEGGQLILKGTATAHCTADLTVNCTGCKDVGRGCTPPVLDVLDDAQLDINGLLQLVAAATTTLSPYGGITLGGSFDNQSTDPTIFDWSGGSLVLDGSAGQTFEVAGTDRGPNPIGLVDNFALGMLQVTAGANVLFVDAFDNDQAGQGPCTEALYVHTLSLAAGSAITVNDCRIYCEDLKDEGASITLNGCAALVLIEPDGDGDGIGDSSDNCPLHYNPNQEDCDGDEIGDVCAIAEGISQDCNSNSVPDECDIDDETSEDCQPDGIPDECQICPDFYYQSDDGVPFLDWGWGGYYDVAWLNAFSVEPGAETINTINVAWGSIASGTPATVHLWRDDGSGDPTYATLLVSAATTVENPMSGEFSVVEIPPTTVGSAGEGFFAGVVITCPPYDHPALASAQSAGALPSWYAVSGPGMLDPDDLGGALVEPPTEFMPFLSWMVRAVTFGNDTNGNGVPDECEGAPQWCLGDMDCSGGAPAFTDIVYFVAAINGQASWEQYYEDHHGGDGPPCPWLLGDYGGSAGVEFLDIVPFANSIGQPCIVYGG